MLRKFVLIAVSIFLLAAAVDAQMLKTTVLSAGLAGNNRFPGICENAAGERLAIWRWSNNGMAYSWYRDGKWSKAVRIPNQVRIDGDYLGSDIVADSSGRFHAVWELMDRDCYYASFKDGAWTQVKTVPVRGKYEGFQIGLDIRSNDELVLTWTGKPSRIMKDCFLGFKNKNESNFSRFINVTDDKESSSSSMIAVDEADNIWMTWKGEEFGGEEILLSCAIKLDKSNNIIKSSFKQLSAEQAGWSFLQWIANNKKGKTMAIWWKNPNYHARLHDDATGKWSGIFTLPVKTDRKPDFSMWSKVVAHNEDFYVLMKDAKYIPWLIKYDSVKGEWGGARQLTTDAVYYYDIYPGYDNILIAWCTRKDPTQVEFATVPVPPMIRVKSVGNVVPQTGMERSFFRSYPINKLSWQANQFNVDNKINVTYYNVYRRVKGAGDYLEAPIMSKIPVGTTTYNDLQIDPQLTYEYYVTCTALINDVEIESPITE